MRVMMKTIWTATASGDVQPWVPASGQTGEHSPTSRPNRPQHIYPVAVAGSLPHGSGAHAAVAIRFARERGWTLGAAIVEPYHPDRARVAHVFVVHPEGGVVDADGWHLAFDPGNRAIAAIHPYLRVTYHREAVYWELDIDEAESLATGLPGGCAAPEGRFEAVAAILEPGVAAHVNSVIQAYHRDWHSLDCLNQEDSFGAHQSSNRRRQDIAGIETARSAFLEIPQAERAGVLAVLRTCVAWDLNGFPS